MRFDDLIGGEGLSAEEEARLRRVHDLLVEAGPPPDLPPALERPAAPGEDVEPPEIPVIFRRRRGLAGVLALAAALAVFAGGYAFGHSKAPRAAFVSQRVVPMHGALNTTGVIRLGRSDDVGNWPMAGRGDRPARAERPAGVLRALAHPERQGGRAVRGVPRQRQDDPVRFTVPYSLRGYDGWVVTAQPAHVHDPGPRRPHDHLGSTRRHRSFVSS